MKKIINKPFLLPVALLVAVAVVVFLVKGKASVVHLDTGYPVKTVQVINTNKIPFRARAMAFGNVKPSVVLNTKSDVNGKVSYMHPDLEKGASLAITTIAGLMPLLFESSTQALILIPLVSSIVFGMLSSTALVLLVLPSIYGILEDMGIVRLSIDDDKVMHTF